MTAGGPTFPFPYEEGLIVIGLFAGREGASGALPGLAAAGFPRGGLALFGRAEVGEEARGGGLGVPEGAEDGERRRDVSWGAAGGAFLGLLLGAEAAALAGLAGLVTLGALAGAAGAGAVAGAIFGDGQAGLDLSEEAYSLRRAVRAGRVLVVAHVPDTEHPDRARRAMEAAGAEEVRVYPLHAHHTHALHSRTPTP